MDAYQRKNGISAELDELVSELVGASLDMLADVGEMPVLLVMEDAAHNLASFEIDGDGPEECLEGAYTRVKTVNQNQGDTEQGMSVPLRYAIAYEGAIEDEDGTYLDALLIEFGERGWQSYSLFSLIEGKGTGEGFRWSEPAPAGEIEPLL